MKRFRLAVLILVLLPITFSWGEEVYCRYEASGAVHYGKVEGESIHQLDQAPWDGGQATGRTIPVKEARLLHPSVPQKIFGISGSYKEAWAGGKKPFNTIRWFLKPPSAAASPDEDVILPASLDELEVETELVLVIGKRVKNAGLDEAKEAIFGYTVGNDVSARDVQRTDSQWTRAKGFDTSCPIGPWIETDLDTTDLAVRAWVDGELRQDGRTSDLIFPVAELIEYVSGIFTLLPGDVILTGTPAGVGPIDVGQRVEVEVEGVGRFGNPVVRR